MFKHQHHRINIRILGTFFFLLTVVILYKEIRLVIEKDRIIDLPQMKAKGELRALTLYSSTSYFIYRDREMGYEYEICSQLAKSLGLKLKMVTAPNINELNRMLDRGEGDLVAYTTPITLESKKDFLFCGREFLSHQVLIQQESAHKVTDVTDLIGKTVVVQRGTRYHNRLINLNKELGGGIHIKTINQDSITTEELIGRVAMGEIDFTISDNYIAQFNKTFYKNLNTSLMLSFNQHSYWVARKTSPLLAAAVNDWFRNNVQSSEYQSTSKRYFEISKGSLPFLISGITLRPDGSISRFDALFKKYASVIDWDWRLLASIAYQESNFDPSATNWTGAKGLMQIMPKTAKSLGMDLNRLLDAETSIIGAVKLLKSFEEKLTGVTNPIQRQKMALASFNCGWGHILDARALARKYKKDPNSWDDQNVGKFILLKSRPEYYQDPVCEQGYLRGSETADFVTEVWARYKVYLKKVKR